MSQEDELPFWSKAVKKVLLQPSSAAAERVFSLLNAYFAFQQEAAMADYLQASVILQYNRREQLDKWYWNFSFIIPAALCLNVRVSVPNPLSTSL